MTHEEDKRNPDDIDTGQPIQLLMGLGEQTPASENFLFRLKNSIERRRSMGHLLDFTWSGPALFFIQFIEMLVGLLTAQRETGR